MARQGWIASVGVAVALQSGGLYAQESPGPGSQPIASPGSYEALIEARAAASNAAARAELSFVWLLENPADPRAPEIRREAMAEMEALKTEAALSEGGQDAVFLADLLVLFDPKDQAARIAAVARLSASGDTRAVVPLLYALRDTEESVRESVAGGLGSFVDLRIEDALAATLQSTFETERVRIAAARSLGAQKTPRAGDVLLAAFEEEQFPRTVREASREVLLTQYPDRLAESERVIDRRGRAILVPASSLFGGYALATVGVLGQNPAGIAIGSVGGLLLGGSASYLLTQKEDTPIPEAAYLTTTGAWGLGAGLSLGAAINQSAGAKSPELVMGVGLLGEAAGLGLGVLTRDRPWVAKRTEVDHAEANLGGAMGLLFARGLNVARDDFFVEVVDPEFGFTTEEPEFGDEALLSASLGLGGLLAVEALSPQLNFTPRDLGLMTLCGYEGGFYGGLSPFLNPNLGDQEQIARSRTSLGIAAGVVGCGALSQFTELGKGDLREIVFADTFGKAAGLSVPLMLRSPNLEPLIAGPLVGGAVGLTAGVLARREVTLTSGDTVLTGFGTALGAFQGFALYLAAIPEDKAADEELLGAALMGGALGGLGTMALSQKLDLSSSEAMWLSSGAFWGAWFSSFYSLLDSGEDDSIQDDFGVVLAATDLGLAATAVMLSPKIGVHPTQLGITTMGGLAGATAASLGTALFSLDGDNIIKANLAGSAVGLGVGAFLASRYEPGKEKKQPKAARRFPALKAPQVNVTTLQPISPKEAPPMALTLGW